MKYGQLIEYNKKKPFTSKSCGKCDKKTSSRLLFRLGCDLKNFEINPIFLIKPFFHMIKKSRQKFKHLENE